ncbi:MAG: hypothetical protein DRP72_01905 [Candidatus Omnitrophota bacterium]|nr:MAG: hypothetical protein DRP72_01905 [Candidatus Omnitrophota bacterium]
MSKKRMLIISLSGIGNTLLALPFLTSLKDNFSSAQIDLVCLTQGIVELLSPRGLIDNFYVFSRNIVKVLFMILRLRRNKYLYSFIIFPSNKWQFDLVAFMIGARYRVTHCYKYRSKINLSFLQNIRIKAEETLHDVEQNLNFLKIFNINSSQREVELFLDDRELAFAEDFLKNKGLQEAFLVGIHPGGGGRLSKKWQGRFKRWPVSYFSKLCDRLIEQKGAKILIFGGREESEIKKEVKRIASHKESLFIIEELSLRRVSALIKKCKLFISNDTALMHISAALGVSTLGIFGPTNWRRTAPYSNSGYYISSDIPCSPCLKYPFFSSSSKIKCNKGVKCLKEITVEKVMDKLKELNLI